MPANEINKTRLDRIEGKIDKMSEAVIALARAEEKIVNLDKSTHVILKRMVDQDERLRLVEQSQHDNTVTLKTIKSVVWTTVTSIITASAAAIVWVISGGGD